MSMQTTEQSGTRLKGVLKYFEHENMAKNAWSSNTPGARYRGALKRLTSIRDDLSLESFEDALFRYKQAQGKKADGSLNRMFASLFRHELRALSDDLDNEETLADLGVYFSQQGEMPRKVPYPPVLIKHWLNGNITPLPQDAERIREGLNALYKEGQKSENALKEAVLAGDVLEVISCARHYSLLLEKLALLKQVVKELGFDRKNQLIEAMAHRMGANPCAIGTQFEQQTLQPKTLEALEALYLEREMPLSGAVERLGESFQLKLAALNNQTSDQLAVAVMLEAKQQGFISGNEALGNLLHVSRITIHNIIHSAGPINAACIDALSSYAVKWGIIDEGVLQAMRVEDVSLNAHLQWREATSFGPALASLLENIGENATSEAIPEGVGVSKSLMYFYVKEGGSKDGEPPKCPSERKFENMLRNLQSLELRCIEDYPDSFHPLLWEKVSEGVDCNGKEIWRLNQKNIDEISEMRRTLYNAHRRNNHKDKSVPAPEVSDEVALHAKKPNWPDINDWPEPDPKPVLQEQDSLVLEGRVVESNSRVLG